MGRSGKMKNARGARIEEVRIPMGMKKWPPSMASLASICAPGRDVVNFSRYRVEQKETSGPQVHTVRNGRPAVWPMDALRPLLYPRPRTVGENATDPQTTSRPDHVIPVNRVKIHSIRPCRRPGRCVGHFWRHFRPLGPPRRASLDSSGREFHDGHGLWPCYPDHYRNSFPETESRRPTSQMVKMLAEEHDTENAILREIEASSSEKAHRPGNDPKRRPPAPQRNRGGKQGRRQDLALEGALLRPKY